MQYNHRMTEQQKLNSVADASSLRSLVAEILLLLDQEWQPSEWNPSKQPVDELVGTILSQNTSDTNTHRAFTSLKSAYPDWQSVIQANTGDVIETIRSGGLANQKAPRIQAVLREVVDEGDSDPNATLLARLERMSPSEAMNWLSSFNGIGPKTAACVLLFGVGQPVVPVDTHVHRVARRIGLIGPRVSAERAHEDLLDIVPDEDSYRFHMHLIHHGRRTCRSRVPSCNTCVLSGVCDYRRVETATELSAKQSQGERAS